MDTALDGAVRVFCERGYHATSIGDLTAAMRLATGSVYKAFRDKHAVFLAAFERYATVRREQTRSAAARGVNGRERLRHGAITLGIPKVTGRGLLLGLHLDRPAIPVQQALFHRRVLTGTASDPNVLRLMPPLTFATSECNLVIGALEEALQ